MSSSGLDPKGPSQPNLDAAYTTAGNPATKEPAEKAQANQNDDSPAMYVQKSCVCPRQHHYHPTATSASPPSKHNLSPKPPLLQ